MSICKYKGWIFIFCSTFLFNVSFSQISDSLPVTADSAVVITDSTNLTDTAFQHKEDYHTKLQSYLSQHRFLNSNGDPEFLLIQERKFESRDIIFYSIMILLLLFGLLKTFYSRYLNNLFRVFFNTSLRQSQLTDQLLQAKLPSLLFNIFFVLTGGFYLYLLLYHLGHIGSMSEFHILFFCIAAITIVYTIKFLVLKFTGWISGNGSAADTYIFIIFLINKIIAIVLMPVIIIMAFSEINLVKGVIFISFLVIFLMLLLRFLKSYSILQNKVKVQRYHFFLYIIGIEILPLLLIYKSAIGLLTNNL